MSEYDNTNRGVLFRQPQKTDKHPSMTGTLNINGVDHWISAWTQTSKDGNKYLSLSLGDVKDGHSKTVESSKELNDEIPF